MGQKIISDYKLTALADAVRNKTGMTASLTLKQMADEINGLVTEENYIGPIPAIIHHTSDGEVGLYAEGTVSGQGIPSPTAPIIPVFSESATVTSSDGGGSSSSISLPKLLAVKDTNGNYIAKDRLIKYDAESYILIKEVQEYELSSDSEMSIYTYMNLKGLFLSGTKMIQGATRAEGWSTHCPSFTSSFTKYGHTMWLGVNGSVYIYWIGILDVLGISTIEEFKEWLAGQKENGTPVRIWQVLPNPILTKLDLGELKSYPEYTEITAESENAPEITVSVENISGLEITMQDKINSIINGKIRIIDTDEDRIQKFALSWKPLLEKLILRSSSVAKIDSPSFIATPVNSYAFGNISRSYTRKQWEDTYGVYGYNTTFTGLQGNRGDLVYFTGTISDESDRPCWMFGEIVSNWFTHYWTDDEEEANALMEGQCLIYVPDDLIDLYKASEDWAAYSDSFRRISEVE